MQMRPLSLPDQLAGPQLEKYIRHLIKAILEQTNTHMEKDQLNELVKQIAAAVSEGMKNEDGTVNIEKLRHPNFIKNLVIACVFNMTQQSLDNNPDIQKLRSQLDSNSPLLKLNPAQLAVIAQIIKENMKLVLDMQKSFILKPTPTPTPTPKPEPEPKLESDEDKKKKEEEELALKELIERYLYLYAIDPGKAGSNPIIISMKDGNRLGIVDQSYGQGNDPISEATKLLDADGTLNTKVLASAIATGEVTPVIAASISKDAEVAFTNPTPKFTPSGAGGGDD